MTPDGYKEVVSDEQLINMVETGVQNSTGDWLNSSELARERLKATYEYAGVADYHLSPQGVSTIVDTSTTEVVEAYTAVLSDLFLTNKRLARFMPWDSSPAAIQAAKDASDLTNYCIFKKNDGWELIQQWMKAALLWKNATCRWAYVEDYDYVFEEYERISQPNLDELLADDNVEIVGNLEYENQSEEFSQEVQLMYIDVRIRKRIDKSRVKIELIPPENFRISRDATCIDSATFVGMQTEMTRSEIRKYYPDMADNIDEWDELGDDSWVGNTKYSQDIAARKQITGQEYYQGSMQQDILPLEANREVVVTECWMRVDRDGDGIAELKHFIIAGSHILHEEDCDEIPMASIVPIDIPFEFYGLSMADFTRSSTLASTAILRGFVENTYLTNYSPKLADPNVVDFSALQNMKPKQIIPTNGNPTGAVAQLPPETISTGTVPLLEHLQLIKEQATGMSKAAQGLNDTLYVSGNSEQKLSAVQSAAQKRIQHIARRFAETGFKRLLAGVYSTMRRNTKGTVNYNMDGVYKTIDMSTLPSTMDLEVLLDIGENSNSSLIQKYSRIGAEILPGLAQQGSGIVVKPEAPAVLATKLIEAMDIDSNDFLVDYNTDEFKEKATQAMQQQQQQAQADQALQKRKVEAEAALSEANVVYTGAQTKNTMDDNAKQLAVSIDKHFQEWADLQIKATKEGAELPEHPGYDQIIMLARQILSPPQQQPQPQMGPQGPQEMK
tara:strand:- start:3587 stop:5767 length:2181 start_codon:yes stop_codon:yes gene_type:complete